MFRNIGQKITKTNIKTISRGQQRHTLKPIKLAVAAAVPSALLLAAAVNFSNVQNQKSCDCARMMFEQSMMGTDSIQGKKQVRQNEGALDVDVVGEKEAVDKVLNGITLPTGLILASRDAKGKGAFIDGLRELELNIAKALNCQTLTAADLENYASGKLEKQADVDAIRVALDKPTGEQVQQLVKIADDTISGAGKQLMAAGLSIGMPNVSVALMKKEMNFKEPFNETKEGFELNGKRYSSFMLDGYNDAQREQVRFFFLKDDGIATKLKTSKEGECIVIMPLNEHNKYATCEQLHNSLQQELNVKFEKLRKSAKDKAMFIGTDDVWRTPTQNDKLYVPNIEFKRTVKARDAFGGNTTAIQIEQFQLDKNGAKIESIGALVARSLSLNVDYTDQDIAIFVEKDGEMIYGLKCVGNDRALMFKEK